MKALNKIKLLYKRLRGLFPSPIPTGMQAFYAWSDDLSSTYWMPTEDVDSIRYALATVIMHLGPTAAYRSQYYFVLTLRASAAKQVAGGVFHEIKTKQQAAQAEFKKAADGLEVR